MTSANTPYEGTYHLEVDKGAEVVRSLDLSGETLMRLQFRGKVTSLTGNRQGRAEVSSDGVVWNVVRTWTSADPGGVYQYEDIDLSPYTMSSQFWVKFKLDGGRGQPPSSCRQRYLCIEAGAAGYSHAHGHPYSSTGASHQPGGHAG